MACAPKRLSVDVPTGFTGKLILVEGKPERTETRGKELWVFRESLRVQFVEEINFREPDGSFLPMTDPEQTRGRGVFLLGGQGFDDRPQETVFFVGDASNFKTAQSRWIAERQASYVGNRTAGN